MPSFEQCLKLTLREVKQLVGLRFKSVTAGHQMNLNEKDFFLWYLWTKCVYNKRHKFIRGFSVSAPDKYYYSFFFFQKKKSKEHYLVDMIHLV